MEGMAKEFYLKCLCPWTICEGLGLERVSESQEGPSSHGDFEPKIPVFVESVTEELRVQKLSWSQDTWLLSVILLY